MTQGRTGATWRALAVTVRGRHEPCIRCGQPINYALDYIDTDTGRPNPNAFSVDHYPHPLAKRPDLAETLTNLRAAHLHCNQSASDGNTKVTASNSRRW